MALAADESEQMSAALATATAMRDQEIAAATKYIKQIQRAEQQRQEQEAEEQAAADKAERLVQP